MSISPQTIKVLVACEFSGRVREAFRSRSFDAWSCDLQATELPGQHYQCDVREILNLNWDIMVGHPCCRFLALCQIWRKYKPGQEWRKAEEDKALDFANMLWGANIPHIALEQPKSILSTRMAPKSQTIHPWQFGHGERKETWLWLKNLPPLVPANIVSGREQRVWKMPPSPTRSNDRSRTYQGIADAMADQWGRYVIEHKNPLTT